MAVEHVPDGPVYFPAQRVACTPVGDRLRVAGMMEFRRPEAALDQRRIQRHRRGRPSAAAAGPTSTTARTSGSARGPARLDGLPLIGATKSSRVFAAGGHGMWGITLGPVTGRLLAQQMVTGKRVAELAPFDPLR